MNDDKIITMRSIAYDTVPIKADSAVYQFFVDNNTSMDKRVNLLLERELVKFLFDSVNVKLYEYLIFEELGIRNTYTPFYEQSYPIIDNPNEKPGDIDLLLVDKSHVIDSIGFQVKKIKGFIDVDNLNKIKFSNIEEGILQANKMFDKYKFRQNYLMLIVANDGISNTSNNFFFRHVDGSEINPLYSSSTYEKLREGIGVFIIEITQPTSKDISKSGKIASKLFIKAKEYEQSELLNAKIRLLFNNKIINYQNNKADEG